MRISGLTRRLVALHLLLALAAVTGGRLTLDARAAGSPQGSVEVEHVDGCLSAHDHRLCVLVYAPWSAAAAPVEIAALAPPVGISLGSSAPEREGGLIRRVSARAPPAIT